MASAEIVVSGRGIWSAAGTSPEAVFEAALSGTSPASAEWMGGRRFFVARAPEPPVFPAFPQSHRMDRSARLALAAAGAAHAEARLGDLDGTRLGVVVGCSRGPIGKILEPPGPRVRPTQAVHTAVAAVSGALSLALEIRGPCLTVSATCASAAQAVALGVMMIRTGAVDAVLAGGVEAPLVSGLMEQLLAAGILGTPRDRRGPCRPFDRDRDGTLAGEGAGFLVLEPADAARRRGVPIHAVLAGVAMGAESHNRVAARADGEGLSRVIEQALAMAGAAPEEVGHVNAHGTGTRLNDAAEAAALRCVFGERVDGLPVTSTKALTGHAFGASAALEAMVAIESLRRQCAPPTVGCEVPDPELGLDIVLGGARPLRGGLVLSTSLGFWGNLGALVFRRP